MAAAISPSRAGRSSAGTRAGAGGCNIVTTDDELAALLSAGNSPELVVVDMYARFAGPCEPIDGLFRRLRLDLGPESLRYVQAQTDNISYFQTHRDRSCPTFSVWLRGVLVAVVLGANAPLLESLVQQSIALAKSTADRPRPVVPCIDIPQEISPGCTFVPGLNPVAIAKQEETSSSPSDAMPVEAKERMGLSAPPLQDAHAGVDAIPAPDPTIDFTVVLLKPEVSSCSASAAIRDAFRAAQLTILHERRIWLTSEISQTLYTNSQEQDIQHLVCAPCIAMALSGGTGETVDCVLDVVGRELNPSACNERTLRARYGKDIVRNAFYASSSKAAASTDYEALFCRATELPSLKPAAPGVSSCISAFSPLLGENTIRELVSFAISQGLEVYKRSLAHLTPECLADLGIIEKSDAQPGTDAWRRNMCDIVLLRSTHSSDDSCAIWNELLGPVDIPAAQKKSPNSIRARYGLVDVPAGGIAATNNAEACMRARVAIFGEGSLSRLGSATNTQDPNVRGSTRQQTLAVIKPDAMGSAGEIIAEILGHELGFAIIQSKTLTMTLEIASEFYSEHKGKPFFDNLISYMTSGPIRALVLERDGAIEQWRTAIGPTNSQTAKATAPKSLRARHGTDATRNALHGSDSESSAQREILALFGQKDPEPNAATIPKSKSAGPTSKTKSVVAPAKAKPKSAASAATGAKPKNSVVTKKSPVSRKT